MIDINLQNFVEKNTEWEMFQKKFIKNICRRIIEKRDEYRDNKFYINGSFLDYRDKRQICIMTFYGIIFTI